MDFSSLAKDNLKFLFLLNPANSKRKGTVTQLSKLAVWDPGIFSTSRICFSLKTPGMKSRPVVFNWEWEG